TENAHCSGLQRARIATDGDRATVIRKLPNALSACRSTNEGNRAHVPIRINSVYLQRISNFVSEVVQAASGLCWGGSEGDGSGLMPATALVAFAVMVRNAVRTKADLLSMLFLLIKLVRCGSGETRAAVACSAFELQMTPLTG